MIIEFLESVQGESHRAMEIDNGKPSSVKPYPFRIRPMQAQKFNDLLRTFSALVGHGSRELLTQYPYQQLTCPSN
ncbi:hypothetical protein AOY38_00660 [Synechocystis sp. PCC 6803]|nr:hypothetical protein AOY38_00660 [Synechocystis sp. PCC 6803]AVP88329.1 hypothetical protein C7I86_00670 [Synechocystis sp. IPPAS B-1465]